MTKPSTTVKELIEYLKTLDPETNVEVMHGVTGYENYTEAVDMIIDENTDYYVPVLKDIPPTLTFGER